MGNKMIYIHICDICGEEQEEEMTLISMSEGTFDICSDECENKLYNKFKKSTSNKQRATK